MFAGGVAPPAGTLGNPFTHDRQAATDGERIFRAMNCDGCHGGGALGWEGPSLVDGRWRYGGADGIWKIVTYLRAQPVPQDVPTETWR